MLDIFEPGEIYKTRIYEQDIYYIFLESGYVEGSAGQVWYRCFLVNSVVGFSAQRFQAGKEIVFVSDSPFFEKSRCV